MKNGKIATVTVTYNRKELLKENIEMILNQSIPADCIIIVDNNSTDGTKDEIMTKYNENNKIKYIYLDSNIGGAGGFYTGCKYAYENGYDWVILMDDDGKMKNEFTIENLFNELEIKNLTSNDKVMLNSLVLCNENELSFGLINLNDTVEDIKKISDNNVVINKISPFNGTLISKSLIEKIGYPNKDFFIKGDEYDYYCRAMEAKAYIATVINSEYYHPKIKTKNTKTIRIFNKNISISIEAPWKEYYRSRNYTYMYVRTDKIKLARKQCIKKLLATIIFKCEKVKTIKMILKGYRDGKNGRLGATIKP